MKVKTSGCAVIAVDVLIKAFVKVFEGLQPMEHRVIPLSQKLRRTDMRLCARVILRVHACV